jgi:hypothetical protein
MFDILVLIGLGVISGLGVNTAFQSHRHFQKVQSFAEMQISIMEDNKRTLENITADISHISSNFKREMSEIVRPTIPCLKYESGECSLCNGTGDCKLDLIKTMATKPQKKGLVVK